MDLAQSFVELLLEKTLKAGIEVESMELDHICYRVESLEEYREWKEKLSEISELLIEDEINGRLISTFKLYEPITLGQRSVRMIELPMPKPSTFYPSGWEHGEFVVGKDVDLVKFANSYPNLTWDYSGSTKELNSDIRLELSTDPPMCIKFHHLPLDKVIEIEKEQKLSKQ